jgi:hypothetical protein
LPTLTSFASLRPGTFLGARDATRSGCGESGSGIETELIAITIATATQNVSA